MRLTISLQRRSGADVATITVFKAGQDGYHTYRIPVIVRAKNGDLLAIAEGRKNSVSDHGDIDIVLKRSSDEGKTWGRLELVQDEEADPKAKVWIGNPTPVVDRIGSEASGPHLVGVHAQQREDVRHIERRQRQDLVKAARDHIDGGEAGMGLVCGGAGAWDSARARAARGTTRSLPAIIRIKATKTWGSHIVYSDDHGATWKLGAVGHARG